MEAIKPREVKPWLRRVVEAAGVWLRVMTCGDFLVGFATIADALRFRLSVSFIAALW
jgi:hypothetical protein